MSNTQSIDDFRWFALQTISNQEARVKQYIDKFVQIENMGEWVKEVLVPTETVSEVKGGKKISKVRKFYPGYVFIHIKLYDEDGKILQGPWLFVKGIQGVINFVGGERPVALKEDEINRILNQVREAVGKEVPKVQYEVGQTVKISDGPFMNLTGRIDELDPERGKLKVSVSIFGRFTPVELEYWQIERADE